MAAAIMIFALTAIGFLIHGAMTVNTEIYSPSTVNSFEQCAEHGYPIMESYPEQCRTPDGRVFMKVIAENIDARVSVASSTPDILPAPESSVASSSPARLDSVHEGERIVSPLTLSGSARGNWYFEASFPILLLDNKGNTITESHATAKADWMTDAFVPFNATLTWASTTATSGVIVLKRDNPSGLPEHDAQIRIPIAF